MKCISVAAAVLLGLSLSSSHAQRLDTVAVPTHYDLTFTPDLQKSTFSGEETIALQLEKETNIVTLHSAELKIIAATIEAKGKIQTGEASFDEKAETVSFRFPQPVSAGTAKLQITYSGLLNKKLRGFYAAESKTNKYALTQFEATDARRAFPSFDEPARKATFSVKIVADKDDTAISNTEILSDVAGPVEGKHTISFAQTPKMSTYLLAFQVGKFQCLSDVSDQTKIRVCAPPEDVERGKFALSAAVHYLHFYNDYFGVRYPLPKLDLIALPQLKPGAMENFGAISFRPQFLLTDPEDTEGFAKESIATVIAHEMSHQWFGDLVTMNWWNDVWLNEGLATWMEAKAVHNFQADWKQAPNQAIELSKTLSADAQRVTRPIHVDVNTPTEIQQMFGTSTYAKAGAVLSMVENYVGEKNFQRGIQKYLKEHLYANTAAEDFWQIHKEVSGKPVDKILSSYVQNNGFPLITLSAGEKGKLQITQQRFHNYVEGATEDKQQVWSIPVCFQLQEGKSECQVITEASQTLSLPAEKVLLANAGGKGFYRTQYAPKEFQHLVSSVPSKLQPQERLSLIADQWSLMLAGKASVADYLALVQAESADKDPLPISNAFGRLVVVKERIVSPDIEKGFAEWVSQQAYPTYQRLKQQNRKEDASAVRMLFIVLGSVGRHPQIVAEAHQILDTYLNNPQTKEDPNLGPALAIACQTGDQALYERMLETSKTASQEALKLRATLALANFSTPNQLAQTLDYALSEKLDGKSSSRLLATLLGSPETREAAWKFIQEHWQQIRSLDKVSGLMIMASTGRFCSADLKTQAATFFQQNPVENSGHMLEHSQESASDCIQLHTAQEQKLKDWLSKDTK